MQNYRLILLIILLGACLRFFRLEAQSLWFDEAARLAIASGPSSRIVQNVDQDTQPPLYHLSQHVWLTWGTDDFHVRFLPAAMGILLIAVVYRLGRDIFDPRTAAVAAALTALMPYQVYQSQQANLYAFLVLLSGLQILTFQRAMKTNRRRDWALFGLWTLLGLYTQYLSAFVTITLHLIWLIYHRRYPNRLRSLLTVDGLVGLVFLPQLAQFMKGLGTISGGFWLEKPGLLAPLVTLHTFTASFTLPGFTAWMALFVTVALLVLGSLELAQAIRRRHHPTEPLVWLALLTFFPITLSLFISQIIPIYLDRALITIAPAYILLLARAFTVRHRKSPLGYFVRLTAAGDGGLAGELLF